MVTCRKVFQCWKTWDVCCALPLINRHLNLGKIAKLANYTTFRNLFLQIEFVIITNKMTLNFLFSMSLKPFLVLIQEIAPVRLTTKAMVWEHWLRTPVEFGWDDPTVKCNVQISTHNTPQSFGSVCLRTK